VLGAPLLLGGCGRAPAAFGSTAAAARAHGESFFEGLALRFVNVQRAPRFAEARVKLGRYALTPSKLVDDTSVWTTVAADGVRLLELEGNPTDRQYWFRPRAAAPAPDRPGEARHVMRLSTLGDGAFQWNTIVEQAVGRVRADDAVSALVAALARLERPGGEVRRELHAAMPRTTAMMGRLFTLDTVLSRPVGDGSWIVESRVSLHPERLRATMPAFAKYVEKYVSGSRYDIAIGDGRGARFLEARAAKQVLTFRMRLRDGELLALDGPARPMPDQVELRTETFVHVMLWDVGVSDLVGDLAFVRTTHERGISVRWRRKPDWHLPLGVRHLINGTLDRPFAGGGMLLRLTLRDAAAGQTLVVRRLDVAVQESAVVRWLGNLGGKAMSDFAGAAEVEENRFTAEALLAMRADLAAALGGG
jgi:hypothetical protein